MRRIAIFGGTFDPVHWGHLLVAEAALNQLKLDKILWVPTHNPPYKSQPAPLSFEHRLAMVQRAIADHTVFTCSDLEASYSGSSYAINTLWNLQQLYPDTDWYWIIGLDAFQTLPRWYRSQELADQCEWLVAPRPQAGNDSGMPSILHPPSFQTRWQLLRMPWVGISSSLIRQHCREQLSIRYLVPDAVRAYICDQQLYKN